MKVKIKDERRFVKDTVSGAILLRDSSIADKYHEKKKLLVKQRKLEEHNNLLEQRIRKLEKLIENL